jgi:hypothetical protein
VCLLEALGVTRDTLWAYQVSLKDSSGIQSKDDSCDSDSSKEKWHYLKTSITKLGT